MPNVVHFEICVDDLDLAANFYAKVFDWNIQKADDGSDYQFIITDKDDEFAITGGLTKRIDEWDSTVNTIDVPSVDRCAKKIAAAGGRILAPKTAIPGVGYVQYCQDLEGNSFGIMEYDDSVP
jgi:predicted enzyme related to lactoylglutathione lyase